MSEFDYIKRNFDSLCDEVASISSRLGTKPPRLVCVTKSGSDEELLSLVRFGARDIGENRPGEVKRRSELILSQGLSADMHEIGTLQRNKVKLVAPCAAMVHSVDTPKLATDISRHAALCGRVIPVLIEVNSGREPNKSGVMPEAAEALLNEICELPGICIKGLMTMGPVCEKEEDIRPYFRETRALFEALDRKYGFGEDATLSMGMSDSYRIAIEEGSTLIRVGRKLFTK